MFVFDLIDLSIYNLMMIFVIITIIIILLFFVINVWLVDDENQLYHLQQLY